jgi:hypothetical protein
VPQEHGTAAGGIEVEADGAGQCGLPGGSQGFIHARQRLNQGRPGFLARVGRYPVLLPEDNDCVRGGRGHQVERPEPSGDALRLVCQQRNVQLAGLGWDVKVELAQVGFEALLF